MKGMKGKLVKKLKSIKPIVSLKQDRIFQVNAADGFNETVSRRSSLKDRENVAAQKPDVVDVEELMRDLEDDEMEEDGMNDKENVRPQLVEKKSKSKEGIGFFREEKVEECVSSFRPKAPPLSESEFRRPDLNSGTLFDPNLLAAFEEAVREHYRLTEAARKARIERERLERRKQEEDEQLRVAEEKKQEEGKRDLGKNEEEPPLKARRIEEDEIEEHSLLNFPEKCPPGGSDCVVFYTTTLRGIRKTFEDCHSIRFLLESFKVSFHERDVSMHAEFRDELWTVLDSKTMPPRLFIKGRYIGGADEVLTLHEQGKLRVLFDGIPIDRCNGPCDACGGVRFVVCFNCNGSHRIISSDGLSSRCKVCNENGLIICPHCCSQ